MNDDEDDPSGCADEAWLSLDPAAEPSMWKTAGTAVMVVGLCAALGLGAANVLTEDVGSPVAQYLVLPVVAADAPFPAASGSPSMAAVFVADRR